MGRTFELCVVDDHPIVRRGIVETFAEQPDFIIVAEGASADDAVRAAETQKPDLILLDVTMPGGGVEAAARIRQSCPNVRIAMLSIREDLATVRAALRAGARGFISKGVEGPELVACARKIAAGEEYVSPDLAARLLGIDAASEQGSQAFNEAPSQRSLTPREDQIFRLLGEGLSNADIGQRLGLTENTVKHYLTPLFHKLGVRNRTEAAVLTRGGAGSRN